MPESCLTSSCLWAGKKIQLTLEGKKHRNSPLLTETFSMTIESIEGNVSVADLLKKCLASIEPLTEIPADLLETLSVRLQ